MHKKHLRIVPGQINRDRKQTGGCQKPGRRGTGSNWICLFFCGVMKKF